MKNKFFVAVVYLIFQIPVVTAGQIDDFLRDSLLKSSQKSEQFLNLYDLINSLDRSQHEESAIRIADEIDNFPRRTVINYFREFFTSVESVIGEKITSDNENAKELEKIYNSHLRAFQKKYPEFSLERWYYQEPATDRNIFSIDFFSEIFKLMLATSI